MKAPINLDSFAELLRKKILAGEETPTELRKWVRKYLGLGKTQGNAFYKKVEDGTWEKLDVVDVGSGKIQVEKGKKEYEENGDTATATVSGVKNLEELVAYAGIDLEQWECIKQKATVWDGKTSFAAEFKKRINEKTVECLLAQFEERASKIAPKQFKYSKPKEDGKLLVLNCVDAHLGKPARGKETGWGDYGLEIAKRVYKDIIDQLVNTAPVSEIETVMLVIGSDMLHFENARVETSSGTRIESDCSWHEMYNGACDLMTDIIEKLASQFKVEVMVITGNHARLSEYALGSYVKAFFRNHENVNVDNRPLDRKYFGFKDNLIGLTHGDSVKQADLPMILMRENQAVISCYKSLTFLLGHRHFDNTVDIKGVRVMTAPAICPPDLYHSSNGYVGSNQCGQALLFAGWGLQQVIYSKGVDVSKIK